KYFPKHENKIRVVPCGVDLEKFKPFNDKVRIEEVKKSLEIEGEYFLYLGTIEPRKNLERLIEAYYIFSQRTGGECPKLVLAGGKGWLYDSIFAKVTELKLSDKIIFTKYVPSEDMNALMCGALAFVFPSVYEGFGMPPLEAMACGVPVLVSGEASLPEVTGDCAVIVDAYSPENIAEGMNKLYSDSNLREELSKRGLERAQSFSWDNSAEILYNVYRELF
ncbi:MAG: glycosyltransferase family 4 protein, partial [Ruminococcus sp.]|nr:glycosyltransferase family 4 protein [Ruminococcus sp.]